MTSAANQYHFNVYVILEAVTIGGTIFNHLAYFCVLYFPTTQKLIRTHPDIQSPMIMSSGDNTFMIDQENKNKQGG